MSEQRQDPTSTDSDGSRDTQLDFAAGPALILAAGTIPLPRLVPQLLKDISGIIAADGGLAHARTLGLQPNLLVGDLDSVSPSLLAAFPDVPIRQHPRAKNELDLELALDAATAGGATELRVLGAFGSRLDQGLAALTIAKRYAMDKLKVGLYGGNHEAHVVIAGHNLSLTLPAGTTVSQIALEQETEVTIQGVTYPLEEQPLPFGSGLGVSNQAAGSSGEATVRLLVHHGSVALLVEHDTNLQPRAAIWGAQEERVRRSVAAADPDLERLIREVAYDDVFARPGLDLRTRELLAVALLSASGAVEQLPTHLRGALLVGASEEELREVLIHCAMFVGFPKALAAMRQLQRFLGDD